MLEGAARAPCLVASRHGATPAFADRHRGARRRWTALVSASAVSLSGVAEQLQVQEASELVRSRKAGRVRTCSIEPVAPRTVEHCGHAARVRCLRPRKNKYCRRVDFAGRRAS
jgi:hypothetical protein